MLTMQDETSAAREALQAGVLGYILKEAASEELVKAVRLAAEGKTYLQPELGARLAAEREAAAPDDLSERELEVLRLIALGHTNNEIAEQPLPERAHGRVPPRPHPAEAGTDQPLGAGPLRDRARA